jgi:hypothetical protein
MRRKLAWFTAMVGAVCLTGVLSAQQKTTTTEMKSFEVISVDGNKLVLRGADGASKEFTVSDDFQFDVKGQKISVHDLKPGMKGTATITTTTTVTPVTVTEVRNGEVIQASGGSVLIRGPNGYKNFTQGEVDKRNITIIRDGKPVDISQLSVGDRLSATIVTEKPPKVMTEQQVQATIHPAAPGAAPAPKTPAPAASAARSAGGPPPSTSSTGAAGTGEKKTLPKTASPLPLIGATGAVCLAIAAALAVRRRRSA